MAGKSKEYSLALKIGAKVDKSVDSSISSVEQKLGSLSGIAGKIAGGIGAAFAAVKIGQFVSDAVDTYKDYEAAISETAAIAGTYADDGTGNYEKLAAAAREAGRATTKTAEESAQALGYMALAGWSVDESVEALQPVLKMSTATNTDLAYTSDLVTDSMANLGLSINDLNRYLDISIQANNKSNQTAVQLQEAYLGVGGTFNSLHTPLEESAALLGVLANRGTKGSEAGTAMSAILVNMQKKTGDSAKAMAKLNVSMYDAEGNARDIVEVFQEISDKTADMTEEERNLIYQMIGGKSHVDSFKKLMQGFSVETADGTKEIYSLIGALRQSDGALDRFYDVKTGTLGASMEILNSAVDDLKISLVERFAPAASKAIKHIAERLPELTDKIGGFIDRVAPKVESTVDYVIDHSDEILHKMEETAKIGAGIWATSKVISWGSTAISTINNVKSLLGGLGAAGGTAATSAGGAAASATELALLPMGAVGAASAGIAVLASAPFALVTAGYYGISKAIGAYHQSLIDAGLEAGQISEGSAEIKERADAVSKMYDEYKRLTELSETGFSLAGDEERRREIEQWFIDNYGQYISAEEQKNGIRKESIEFINNYNQALEKQKEAELEAAYTRGKAEAPKLQDEILEKSYINDDLREQRQQAELVAVQLETVKAKYDAINASMGGAERRSAVATLMSENKELLDSYESLTGQRASLGELEDHISSLRGKSAEWGEQIQKNEEYISKNQKALQGYADAAKSMVEMDFGMTFASAIANGSDKLPVMEAQLESILDTMNMMPSGKEISISDSGSISFTDKQLSELEKQYQQMEFELYIGASDNATSTIQNVDNSIDSIPDKKNVVITATDKATDKLGRVAQKFKDLIYGGFFNVQANAGGTSYADDIFIGGEKGIELVRPKSGSPFLIGQSGPELVTGYEGAQVYSNSETERMISRFDIRSAIEDLSSATGDPSKKNSGGNTQSFVYSPNIYVQGGADESTVRGVIHDSYNDFVKNMRRYTIDKQRKEF